MIQLEIMASRSAATSGNSVPFQIDDLETYSVQVNYTGADVEGTLTLEASNDNSTWILIEDSTQAVTASADHMWNVKGAGYRWTRATWTYASGTGTIQMVATIKEPANRY